MWPSSQSSQLLFEILGPFPHGNIELHSHINLSVLPILPEKQILSLLMLYYHLAPNLEINLNIEISSIICKLFTLYFNKV